MNKFLIENIASTFLDHSFRSPTCPDLEPLFETIAKSKLMENGFYDCQNKLIALVDQEAAVIYKNKKYLRQCVIHTTPKEIIASNGKTIKAVVAIWMINNEYYALAPGSYGAWEVRRKLTYPPFFSLTQILTKRVE